MISILIQTSRHNRTIIFCLKIESKYTKTFAGMLDMQLLNSINMKLQGKDWRCVSGLQKCMEYNMRGGNIV